MGASEGTLTRCGNPACGEVIPAHRRKFCARDGAVVRFTSPAERRTRRFLREISRRGRRS